MIEAGDHRRLLMAVWCGLRSTRENREKKMLWWLVELAPLLMMTAEDDNECVHEDPWQLLEVGPLLCMLAWWWTRRVALPTRVPHAKGESK